MQYWLFLCHRGQFPSTLWQSYFWRSIQFFHICYFQFFIHLHLNLMFLQFSYFHLPKLVAIWGSTFSTHSVWLYHEKDKNNPSELISPHCAKLHRGGFLAPKSPFAKKKLNSWPSFFAISRSIKLLDDLT